MSDKEQKIKEIINEAVEKIKDLEKETEIGWTWAPKANEPCLFLSGHGIIVTTCYNNDIDKELVASLAERGLIAPNTKEGRKTLEQRDEWFRFMFKFMTAGDANADGFGWSVELYSYGLDTYSDYRPTRLRQKKFTTSEKLVEFIESFGSGDYQKGLGYIDKMLKGGLR